MYTIRIEYVWAEFHVTELLTLINRHVGNSQHVVSFWTPWPTQHLVMSPTWPKHVGDMSLTGHRTSPFGQQNRHADIRHSWLSRRVSWFLWICFMLWLRHRIQFIFIAGLFHIYIKCFSTCYHTVVTGHVVMQPHTDISAGSRTVPMPVAVGEYLVFSLSYCAVGYDWGIPPTSYS